MATTVHHDQPMVVTDGNGDIRTAAGDEPTPATSPATTEQVWRAVTQASFAVLSHVTPAGEPRSSGVVYKAVGRRLWVAVAPGGWKARHIAANPHVALTVPVRRGGLLSLVAPIPPATVSFHATATVHPAGSEEARSVAKELSSLLPPESRATTCILEIVPEGDFVTYGVGVPLMKMRSPAVSQGRVPVTPGPVAVG
jgi:hypothetical protein